MAVPVDSVVGLAAAIRVGSVKAADVLDRYLRRIAVDNPPINAVVRLAPDARDRAVQPLDGPLCGVPFTVKDNIATAGLATTLGVPERADAVPATDATVVARLRAAGAILVGKTNCPPWGGGIETDNDLFGRTSNPYDLTRTSGGSSGGAAAAVAAGLSPFGVGTDSGGSVRLPAHFCGVAALKPTAGRIPVTGVLDDNGPIGALSDPRSQVGLLARYVGDLSLLLGIVAGPDGRDAGVPPVPLGDPALVALDGLNIAWYHDGNSVSAETAGAVRAAAVALAATGAQVRPAAPPDGGHELTVEVWRSYDDGLTSGAMYRLLRRWDAYRERMLAFMAEIDLILCPVYPVPAPPHGGTRDPALRDGLRFTTPYSLTGAPCVVVPFGRSPAGLPVGVQLVGAPWQDHVPLAAAARLEQVAPPLPSFGG